MAASLVVTIIGPDRPGLVSLLAERGKTHGASWAESRMASLAGQFAGMVRFEVDPAKADELAASLADLESLGLRVVFAAGLGTAPRADDRMLELELIGHDRPGIVSDISRALADCGVSIEELDTEIVSGPMSGGDLFQVAARLRVPATLATRELRRVLEGLANELMVDITLGDSPPAANAP